MAAKLGIIAGSESLPVELINQCRKTHRPYFVLALKGQTPSQTVENSDHKWVRIAALGEAIKTLKQAGCTEVVFAGGIRRPAWHELRPDARGAKLLAKLAGNAFGDDSVLRLIIEDIEKEGFKVISADDILGTDILAPEGVLTTKSPDSDTLRDIKHGFKVAKLLGQADVGQSVIIQGGMVLGVEAIEGTQALIQRCADLHRDAPGGVLIKCAKPDQERRIDMPSIGIDTIAQAASHKLQGIALEAGSVQMLAPQAVIDEANAKGLFIIGFGT